MRLGRYEIVRTLGRGAHGTVYEAVRHGPGVTRSVALKVMDDGAALLREARLGGLLRHPHIVDCTEVGEQDGTWFVAMELCRGGTLADHAPLPPRAVVDVGLMVCAALEYAHGELGLVHLDLKPANLLLDGAVVKVADLGIARTSDGGPARLAGTPGYMAPELLRGARVDARADVYALGVVLHELATGRRPTLASTLGADDWTGEVEGSDPIAEASWLQPVLDRCLAQDPADRFPTMGAVAEALRAVDAGGPTLAETLGVSPPAARAELGPRRIFGREPELARLASLLAAPGLTTLVGAPGIGKTALAAEALGRARRAGERALRFCDVSGAVGLHGVLSAVAAVLDVQLGRGTDAELVAQLGHALAGQRDVLLVLDGFEHLVGHSAVLTAWRGCAPRARLLVTSRHALGIQGEEVVEVGELPSADAKAMARARALERGVVLQEDDPLLDLLVQRLDGVPLALELAAGRLGVLTLAEVLERLSLSLLRTGRPDAEQREATLRGAIQWSFDLLDEGARSALGQLAVFRGGFTLEAAEAVVALPLGPGPSDAVEVLATRSLVSGRQGRLRLLEPIREFALEHLDEGARRSAERRHAAFYARYGSENALAPDRLSQPSVRAALVQELENLVVACEREAGAGVAEVAVRLLQAVAVVTGSSGPIGRAASLGDVLLRRADLAARDRARAACVAGSAAYSSGQPARARQLYGLALDAAREAEDRALEGLAQRGLGSVLVDAGDVEEGRRAYEAALAASREIGDRGAEGIALHCLAIADGEHGRPDDARAHFEDALRLLRAVGDLGNEGSALGNLACLHAKQGRMDEARATFEAALARVRQAGDRRWEAIVLANLATIRHTQGRPADALTIYGEALEVHRRLGNRRSEGIVLSNIGVVHRQLGAPAAARASYEASLSVALEVGNRRSAAAAMGALGNLDLEQGRPAEARRWYAAALTVFGEIGDEPGRAGILSSFAELEREDGRAAEARACLEAALAVHRRQDSLLGEARVLADLGILHAEEGRTDEAAAALEAARSILVEVRDAGALAIVLAALGDVARRQGDLGRAGELVGQADTAARTSGDTLKIAEVLCAAGSLAMARGDLLAADTALREARSLAAARDVGPTSGLARRLAALGGQIRES